MSYGKGPSDGPIDVDWQEGATTAPLPSPVSGEGERQERLRILPAGIAAQVALALEKEPTGAGEKRCLKLLSQRMQENLRGVIEEVGALSTLFEFIETMRKEMVLPQTNERRREPERWEKSELALGRALDAFSNSLFSLEGLDIDEFFAMPGLRLENYWKNIFKPAAMLIQRLFELRSSGDMHEDDFRRYIALFLKLFDGLNFRGLEAASYVSPEIQRYIRLPNFFNFGSEEEMGS